MNKVTIFPTIKAIKQAHHVELDKILEWIKEGQWRNEVETVRDVFEEEGRNRDSKIYKDAKKAVPCFTGSGTFSERGNKYLIDHSGFIVVDIDEYNGDWDEAKTMIANYPYTYSVFYSIGGAGLAVVIKIDPSVHRKVFDEVKEYYLNTYAIKIDFLHDVARARFVSYDDELVLNRDSKVFEIEKESFIKDSYIQMESQENGQFLKGDDKYHFDLAISWVKRTGWDYIEGKRHSFMVRCANLWNEFGIEEDKVNELLADTYPHFLEEPSNAIAWTYKNKKENFGAKKRRGQLGEIEVNEDGELQPQRTGGNKKGKAVNAATVYILETWGEHLFRNELNDRLEYKRQPITDRFINDVWIACNTSLSSTVTQTDVNSILNSSSISVYNPIRDFFECQKLETTGNIDKLAKSLNTTTYDDEFTALLMKKWIVGAVANIFEPFIKSPLQLVLFGGQDTGKSYFFRKILPDALLMYYAEDKLDAPKDAAQLMCAKILIMDDEYGGKSKHDSKVLKDLISKHEFTLRLPYAKMPTTMRRIATLCGTTNEPDILTDTTGNRRIIPMEILERNYDLYDAIDKCQLWAEAYELYKLGFRYELTREEVKKINEHTHKFERESLEAGLLHKYFRAIPEDECSHLSFKAGNNAGFSWKTTTEIILFIQDQCKVGRINKIQLGKELAKCSFFQKSLKVKGKVARYWAVKKIGDGADIEEYEKPPF